MLGIDYQADETFSNVNGEGQLRAHFQTVRALHFNVDQKPVSADELTAMYALTGELPVSGCFSDTGAGEVPHSAYVPFSRLVV